MKKVLRSLIFVLVLLTAVCAAIPVFAASFPTKPVLAVVPFSPGGGNDIVIRLVAKYMTPALGQSLVVENKPGAGGFSQGPPRRIYNRRDKPALDGACKGSAPECSL